MKRNIFAKKILGILLLSSFCCSGQAAIKCWTNDKGHRACGDKVPPEYAQQGHEEVSVQGRVVEEHERAKTEEEIAEERRLEAVEEAKQKQAEAQARLDKILMDTFSTVDDIEMTRDGKIAAIDSSISLTKRRNNNIQEDLDTHIKEAADAERNGQTPADDLLRDIESLKRQISNNDEFIQEKNAEKEMLREAYDADIERFKRLRAESR